MIVSNSETNPAHADTSELVARPYAERQKIVVIDDVVLEAERRSAVSSRASTHVVEDDQHLHFVRLSKWVDDLGEFADSVKDSVKASIHALWQMRVSGADFLPVSRTDAAVLRFPPGHPLDRVLYIGHPVIPAVYFPAAFFHRLTFEHKFCELIELLTALGAKTLRVEHREGWDRDVAATINTPLKNSDRRITADLKRSKNHSASLLYEATLKGTSSPGLPDEMAWYPHEPTWQQVANGRLNFGLTECSITIRYEDSFQIDGKLESATKKAGISLGGHFHDAQTTVWQVEGTFTV